MEFHYQLLGRLHGNNNMTLRTKWKQRKEDLIYVLLLVGLMSLFFPFNVDLADQQDFTKYIPPQDLADDSNRVSRARSVHLATRNFRHQSIRY